MNHKKIYEKLNSGKETGYGNKNVVMGGYHGLVYTICSYYGQEYVNCLSIFLKKNI